MKPSDIDSVSNDSANQTKESNNMAKIPEKILEAYQKLPQRWRLEKLKFFANVQDSSVNKIISEDEKPVWLCTYTDVYYNDRIVPDMQFRRGSATEMEIKRFQLKRGQVIITKYSEEWEDIGVPTLVTKDMPEVLCCYHLSVFEPGPELDAGFLAWLCRAEPLNNQFKLSANGVTRFVLVQYSMKNAFITLPPLKTQQQIARFLDDKTAHIDGLIKKKRELLKCLAEKRQALITRVVTKGIDPDAPMKPSDVGLVSDDSANWTKEASDAKAIVQETHVACGGLPKGWVRRRLRFDTCVNPKKSLLNMKSNELVSFIPMDAISEYGGLNLDDVRELGDVYDNYTYFADGDVCVPKITPCFENGKVALAKGLKNGVGFGTTELHILRPEPSIDRHFLFYISLAHDLRKLGEAEMYGAGGQKRIDEKFIKNWMASIPPLKIQQQIARFLDKSTAQIDQAVEKIEDSIAQMEEYRSALITAAVTGQLPELQ